MLYKYRFYNEESKERTLQIINEKKLFFAGIKSFNDPFDGKVLLKFEGKLNPIRAAQIRTQYTMKLVTDDKLESASIDSVVSLVNERITESYILNKDEQERIYFNIQEMHNSKGVLSLSSKNDNILMWSHYSNNHRGVCFGFDFNNDSLYNATKVKYQTHYDNIWGWLHTDEEIVERILFTKAIDWQYEKEYRVIRDSPGAEKFSSECLKEIIFGAMMSDTDKLEIINACNQNRLNVSFKQAVLNVERFEIDIVDYPLKG